MRRHVFLAVRDGIITAIGPAADLPRHAAEAVDDLSHCVIVPALVDCSVSLSRSPSVDEEVRLSMEGTDLKEKASLVARHVGYCHAHGVQGVADSDNITELMDHLPKELPRGSFIDIRIAGSRADSDFLRIDYSGNIEDQGAPRLGHEELCRLLQQRGGKKAVVVANGQQQVEEALRAGCDAIEQGYGMGEGNLRKMADMGVLWIPSVIRAKNALDSAASGGTVMCRFSTRYVAPGKADPGAETFWKKTVPEQLMQLRLARELGVTTAIGTGAGSVGILHGESMVEEMKLFIRAGYSLPETIRCASENGARFFDMENLGALTVGRKATFLITRGGAQQLPRKLSYLEGIYVNGEPSSTYSKNPVKAV